MLVVISPAKRQRFPDSPALKEFSLPVFMDEASTLVENLRKFSPTDIESIMRVSPELARQTFENFQTWHQPFNLSNARQSVFVFDGDVFGGLDAGTLKISALKWAQKHLRIFSGLYGVLKPLDLIRPYRLDLQNEFQFEICNNLYGFWRDKITDEIKNAVNETGSKLLVNLASNEYFKSMDVKDLKVRVITPDFKEFRKDGFQIISYYAKRARGLMTRFIIENKITRPDDLKAFDYEGYFYNPGMSRNDHLIFTRGG